MSLRDSHFACQYTSPPRPGRGYLADEISVAERHELQFRDAALAVGHVSCVPSLGEANRLPSGLNPVGRNGRKKLKKRKRCGGLFLRLVSFLRPPLFDHAV